MKYYFSLILTLSFLTTIGQSLRTMTYNIRYATENDGVNAWSKRKTKVFDLIGKYNPDILGLQEALHGQITDITEALPEYRFVGVGRDDGKEGGEFSPILFKKDKYELLDQNTFWLSETPDKPGSKGWDAAITRVATWARLKDKETGKTFLIINTHFDHIGKEARRQSAVLLKRKAGELGKKLPTLIIGDFNCQRNEPPYQAMMEAKHLRLIDPAPANPPGTYCTFSTKEECIAIDYIFHTGQWISSDYQVIDDNDGEYYPSDHLPVIVNVKVK